MVNDDQRNRPESLLDRLLELYFLRENAERGGKFERSTALQEEIDRIEMERQAMRQAATTGAPRKPAHRRALEAAQRRHVRDKGVIDHLAREVFKPKPEPSEKSQEQSSTTEAGLSVEEQVRKEWSPKKNGGLPVF